MDNGPDNVSVLCRVMPTGSTGAWSDDRDVYRIGWWRWWIHSGHTRIDKGRCLGKSTDSLVTIASFHGLHTDAGKDHGQGITCLSFDQLVQRGRGLVRRAFGPASCFPARGHVVYFPSTGNASRMTWLTVVPSSSSASWPTLSAVPGCSFQLVELVERHTEGEHTLTKKARCGQRIFWVVFHAAIVKRSCSSCRYWTIDDLFLTAGMSL